jgi:hypothetical protein
MKSDRHLRRRRAKNRPRTQIDFERKENAVVSSEGPRYDVAAEVAAHIVNVLAASQSDGRAILFGKVLFLILEGIYEAERRLGDERLKPSVN